MKNRPRHKSEKFSCPHCHTIARQSWFDTSMLTPVVLGIYNQIYLDYRTGIKSYHQEAIAAFLREAKAEFQSNIDQFLPRTLSIAICQACDDFSLWVNGDIVYPKGISLEPPNNDLDDEIKSLYNEASKIFLDSPRGSTALLRLALQMLLKQIGKDGKNINKDIKELVDSGLSPKIQKALDLLRVVGNNSVHPGQINLDDSSEVALKLFSILNIISDEMITKPKEIDALYNDVVPDETKEHIDQRDKKTS